MPTTLCSYGLRNSLCTLASTGLLRVPLIGTTSSNSNCLYLIDTEKHRTQSLTIHSAAHKCITARPYANTLAGNLYVYSPYVFKNLCKDKSDAFAKDQITTLHVLKIEYQSSVLLLISDSCKEYIRLPCRAYGTTLRGKCSKL